MFEEFLGLPAHPLLVHTVVVLVPLLIMSALLYALVPPLRRHLGWLTIALGIAAPAFAAVTKFSGDAFRARLVRDGHAPDELLVRIDEHRSFGTWLVYAAVALGVLAILLVLLTRVRDGAPAPRFTPLVIILIVGVLAAGAASGYFVFKAGDSGARIAWSGL